MASTLEVGKAYYWVEDDEVKMGEYVGRVLDDEEAATESLVLRLADGKLTLVEPYWHGANLHETERQAREGAAQTLRSLAVEAQESAQRYLERAQRILNPPEPQPPPEPPEPPLCTLCWRARGFIYDTTGGFFARCPDAESPAVRHARSAVLDRFERHHPALKKEPGE